MGVYMGSEQKELWKKFYLSEQELFAALNEQCECLYSSEEDKTLKYQVFKTPNGAELTKPTRFIHWIGQLKGDDNQVKALTQIVKANYLAAVGKESFKKYPSRFPVFYENVEQINVTCHAAFSSVRAGDEIEVKRYTDMKELSDDVEKLREAGFTPRLRDDVLFQALLIPTHQLAQLDSNSHIQVRKQTGMQYRATVRYTGKSRGERTMLGLMIIDTNSQPHIYRPAPEAPRAHSLAMTSDSITLPIETPYQIYIK